MEKRCQKCAGKMTCSYHQDEHECRRDWNTRKSEPKEHLHWVCQECGYDCTTEPLDADRNRQPSDEEEDSKMEKRHSIVEDKVSELPRAAEAARV